MAILNLVGDQGKFQSGELRLHHKRLGVVLLKVGLHYGSPKVVKLEVGLHHGYFNSNQEES